VDRSRLGRFSVLYFHAPILKTIIELRLAFATHNAKPSCVYFYIHRRPSICKNSKNEVRLGTFVFFTIGARFGVDVCRVPRRIIIEVCRKYIRPVGERSILITDLKEFFIRANTLSIF